MAVDREFYVYRFGRPRTGRTGGQAEGGRADGGRTGGRAAGPILYDSTTIFIDFHKTQPKTRCFSVVSRPAEAQVPIFTAQMKKASKKRQKTKCFLTFQIKRTRKYRFLLIKTRFLNTSANPPDPPEMEHEVRLPTHQQRAGGQDDVSLNKLPQINRGYVFAFVKLFQSEFRIYE